MLYQFTIKIDPDIPRTTPKSALRILHVGSRLYGRIYYAKWIKGDKMIFDLIPIRIVNEPLMYNKIDGKIYANLNSTTSKFFLGPDKNYNEETL